MVVPAPGEHLVSEWRDKIEAFARSEDTNRRQIVALSGGKDSTALALALNEYEPGRYEYVCTPTGNELPEMEEHWKRLEDMLGAELTRLGDRTLMGLIVEQGAIPNHAARWCTRMLKLETYYRWLDKQGPAISYVGLRADEEGRPGMTFPDTGDVRMEFPMQRWGWTLHDVLTFLRDKGVEVPERTDCALCFWQKIGEWYVLWRDFPEEYEKGVMLEDLVSARRGKQYTFRSPQRDSWPASLRELRAEFEAGKVPERSLRMMDKRRMSGACRVCTL